ncbi:MAG: radical SAM protein [Deltaproteobacteria bacterium]|nr:radical SAM protein [Deltaproteobacteria bacterium]
MDDFDRTKRFAIVKRHSPRIRNSGLVKKEVVLLLNPPARFPVLRDYYCSTRSKAGYLWHPIDLLALSGVLGDIFNVAILDCVALGLDPAQSVRRIASIAPGAVIMLVSGITLVEDLAFARMIKRNVKPKKILVLGEPVLSRARQLIEAETCLDGALFDFLGLDAIAILKDRFHDVRNAAYRAGRDILLRRKRPDSFFSLGRIRHDLLDQGMYRLPPLMTPPFASVLCSFGCPYSCAYCNSGRNSLGYAIRDKDDLARELEDIKKNGISKVFFRDMNFPADGQAGQLLEVIRSKGPFKWTCYARPDKVSEDLLMEMAASGCKLVQFGVESKSPELLGRLDRFLGPRSIETAFEAVKKAGMEAGAHFVLGLPGQSEQEVIETLKWAQSLDPAYVSFNLFQYRSGSKLDRLDEHAYPSNNKGSSRGRVPLKRLMTLKKRAYANIYLRPGYIFKRISKAGSIQEVAELSRAALFLLGGLMKERMNN